MYEELTEKLRKSASEWCITCVHRPDKFGCNFPTECEEYLKLQAADAIEELSKPRWISVKERLPEIHTNPDCGILASSPVFFITEHGTAHLGYVVEDSFSDLFGEYTVYRWFERGDMVEDVTHWMPLPEPPKCNDKSSDFNHNINYNFAERKKCGTCKHFPPAKKWPCEDCDMREPADRWELKENK